MPNMLLKLLGFLLLMCASSCQPPQKNAGLAPKIDSLKAFAWLQKGAGIKFRYSGSAGASRSVEFIADCIKKMDLQVKLDKWQEATPAGKIEFCNVSADIPGENDKFILIGCHYDTKKLASIPNFEGANDGASGVALLLAMIQAIKKHPSLPPASLQFVFFDGEECFIQYSDNDGLFGSRRLADKMKQNSQIQNCLAVVIVDMVGDKDLNITLPAGSHTKLADQLIKIAEKQKTSAHFSRHPRDIIDDHTPFQKMEIPVIDIIDFNYGKGNRYWHTSADTVDKTSPKSLEITGNAVLQLLWDIPEILH